MSDNTVIFLSVLARALSTIAAIAGVVFLAYYDKPGWGWLIFVAILISSYSLRSRKDDE